ncbi:MAG: amino acid permease, partial [Gemmatimonadota bacterium]|nr:amino acid permease [Gemmatimonadota bacterium]
MSAARTRLRKELGLFDVYAISTGAMFSSGFFLLPGLAAAKTGPSVALAYLVASLFILPAMFSVAELVTAMPRAGGAYYFLDRSLGPLIGTVGGLGTWGALILKSAFALVGMGAYLALFFDVPIEPVAIALTMFFMILNIVGAKETSGLQRILVVALVAIMVLFIVQGILTVAAGVGPTGGATDSTPFLSSGLAGFMGTVGFVFVSYAGLTKVASVAEEVKNPDRNIPLGMVLSLATAAVTYAVGVYVMVAVIPLADLVSDLTPAATAASTIFQGIPGNAGTILVVIAAIAAFASTGNAGILSSSRYPLAMARDGLVPEPLGRLGRFRTPTLSVVVTSLLIVACILLLDVEGIAKLASAFQLLLFSLLCMAVVIMRESGIHGYDPGYRSPLYPWMQIVGVLAPLWLIAEMGQAAIGFTIGLVAVTVAWYFLYAAARVERAGAIFHAFARLGQRQHAGLDVELRGIVQEKGLRADDPLDEVVARAEVLDFETSVSFPVLVEEAASVLAGPTGIPAQRLRDGFLSEVDGAFLLLASGAALPHLRISGPDRPTLLLVRCRAGITAGSVQLREAEGLEGIRAVFFLVSPLEDPGMHLRLLGHLATHLADEAFLAGWIEAGTAGGLREALLRDEHTITLSVKADRPTAAWIGRPLRSLGLPKETLVAVIRRDGDPTIPDGSTILRERDRLTIIGSPKGITEIRRRYDARIRVGRCVPEVAVGSNGQ